MTDLGPCSYYLGMEIIRNGDNRTVRITQTAYMRKVLDRFDMSLCTTVKTPMLDNDLHKEEVDQANEASTREYQSMIGLMMYPMIQTRPDICFAISMLSRFNHNPNDRHFRAAKRVLRYLKGTLDYEITYGKADGLIGFIDADWATDQESRRSLGAYIFILYGGAIS